MKSHIFAVLLFGLLFFNDVSYTTGHKLTKRELLFSKDEYLNYLSYYSRQQSGPLRRFQGDNAKLFLLTKGAEILAGELSNNGKTSCYLRQIVNVTEISSNLTYNFTLLVEDQGLYKRMFQAVVLAQLSYSSKGTSILAVIISQDDTNPLEDVCDQISSLSNCTECIEFGRCSKGHVPIDHWLKFALKTQRELQFYKRFPDIQFLDGHNAFNNRADMYGVFDDCRWPPPYKKSWACLANQEFSFTDLLDIGVHALELDLWWCFDKIRLSHAHDRGFGCSPLDRHFSSGIKEIGEWVKQPQNKGKIIRIYFEDGEDHTEGHDDLINGPIQEYLKPFVFTPSDLSGNTFWPSVKQLRKLGKTVILATSGKYTHGGKYIHEGYWEEFPVNMFSPYPECGGRNLSATRRYYSDSTNYGPFWDGPAKTGVILDFSEFVKCRVGYPAADQVNPVMLRSAIYTWAEGEPSTNLTLSTCVYMSGSNGRWYVAEKCDTYMYSACSNKSHGDTWIISSRKGPSHGVLHCPEQYQFDVPTDGYKRQKLLESMKEQDVWINVKPFLPLLITENSS